MINPAFDTKGKKCALIPKKSGKLVIPAGRRSDPIEISLGDEWGTCPGANIMEGDGGCPHWRIQTVEFHDAPEETWIGCGIIMDPVLLTGLGKGVQRAAAAVQGTRNAVSATLLGLAEAMELKVDPILRRIKEGDAATREGRPLLEKKATGHLALNGKEEGS